MTWSTKYLAAATSLLALMIAFFFPQLQVLKGLELVLRGSDISLGSASLGQYHDLCLSGAEYSFVGLGRGAIRICPQAEMIYMSFQVLLYISALLLVLNLVNMAVSKQESK